MTMANGVNFTPLQISQLPDDPNKPMYLFDVEHWDKAPSVLVMEMDENICHPTRNSKNDKYKEQNGDAFMWNRYVAFGYYHTKNIYEFIEKWEHVSTSIVDVCKMVWREYSCYLIRQGSPTNPQLMVWTLNIALPFLFNHDPDYHLASILDIEEATNTKLPSYITKPNTWLQIGKKKKKSPPNSPVPLAKPPPPPATQHVPANQSSPFSTLQSLGKIVRRSQNPPSPITKLTTGNLVDNSLESNTSNTPLRSTLPITIDESQDKQPIIPFSEKTNPEPSHGEDRKTDALEKNVYTTTTDNIHHSVHDSIHDASIEQPQSQTDSMLHNSFRTPDIQPHNPYKKKKSNGAPVTQSPDDTTLYNQHQDNASSTNQSTLNTKLAPFVALNDGTQRLTLRWKPSAYQELASDPENWINNVYGLLQSLFGPYKSKIWIVKWEASKNNEICSLDDIIATKGQLREYMSPKVAHLDSTEQFVVGLRITMRDQSPAAWISDPRTKSVMINEKLNVNISNSRCDSGEIVVAGHLLLKHPEHTHKIFYLMALRRQLPESTPFFDIGPMSKAPNGERINHLVIRCGENHANVLMDILSDHLDGQKNTTLFVGHKQMASMTTEEVSDIFRVHQYFLETTQRLSLSPNVVNVDRPRNEISSTGKTITRSTREWVMALKTKSGEPLQCDVENGGRDRQAYMIVAKIHLEQAKTELAKYKASLRRSFATTTNFPDDTNNTLRPTEIYIPTKAVLKNIDFMKRMSSADIWKAAPLKIRQPQETSTPSMQSQSVGSEPSWRNTTSKQQTSNGDEQELSLAGGTISVSSQNTRHRERRPSLDITVETSHSPLTKATNGNTTRVSNISDLEASVARQQAEFKKLSDRLIFIDESAKRANEAYQKMGSLQMQLDQMFLILQKICENVDVNQPTPKRATRKKKKQSTPPSSDISMTPRESSSSEISDINSPEKKKRRSKLKPIRLLANDKEVGNDSPQEFDAHSAEVKHDEFLNSTDQTSVQYTDLCAADDVPPD